MKILVIRLSSLGDIVLSTLLLRALRSQFPDCELHFLVKSQFAELADTLPYLNEYHTYPPPAKGRMRLIRKLRRQRFDIVIDLQNSLRTRRLSRMIHPKKLYRYYRPRFNRWLRIHYRRKRATLSTPPHVAEGYLAVAKNLGLTDDGGGLQLENQAGSRSGIVIAPGARHLTKQLPVEKWVRVLTNLHEKGFDKQTIIGSRDDIDIAAFIKGILQYDVEDFTGQTSLQQLIDTIAGARALITNDSAPMHIAAAVGTPVVAIFGPTVTEFGFAPFRCKSAVVQVNGLECRPCHPHGPKKCPQGHFRCMKDIEVDEIVEQVVGIGEFN